ncbi:hypothetical protein D3C86_1899750 [compost metagenome]
MSLPDKSIAVEDDEYIIGVGSYFTIIFMVISTTPFYQVFARRFRPVDFDR